ncbi:MAG: hypothetical protein ACI90V_009872, partial [Bacillariaceae sp.]
TPVVEVEAMTSSCLICLPVVSLFHGEARSRSH